MDDHQGDGGLRAMYDNPPEGIHQRESICAELGRLRDRSMTDRVLADLSRVQ